MRTSSWPITIGGCWRGWDGNGCAGAIYAPSTFVLGTCEPSCRRKLPNDNLIPCRRTCRHAAVPQSNVWIGLSLTLEQFFAPYPLRVVLVANLKPACVFWQVGVAPALGNNAFQVTFAGEPEQPLTIALDVVAVEKAFTSLRHDQAKPAF